MSNPDRREGDIIPFLVEESTGYEQMKPLWSRIRYASREPFSEFFGTMILILFGDGVVAQVTLSQDQKGDYQSISWGWG
jgi:aquaglyceroporin related protein